MRGLTAIAVLGAALTAGASSGNAETCMIKDQIPVPCAGHMRGPVYTAPAYQYQEPLYAAPAYSYRAPVYAAPVYDDYYHDGGYYDDGDYGYYGAPFFAPSISIGGFFGDFGGHDGRHHHGGHRWHHRR